MLYSLQLVQSYLSVDNGSYDVSTSAGQFLQDWIQRFLQAGGFQCLLEKFHYALDLLHEKSAENIDKFEKSFIELMLQIIKVFMLAACQEGSQDSILTVIQMVKQSSTAPKEDGDADKEN
mmetsp:Transcript_19373/g.14042  ORF Transcript_19373/g.14042 Transcript_19373/m.14042 type:complete len:120 (+) Transcript_19373:194-553(+)